jgi:hypothetical protein
MAETLTVTRKGQDINFVSAFDTLQAAREALSEAELNNGKLHFNQFVIDLLSRTKLSPKQEAWIHYLATESVNKGNQEEEVANGEYLPLVQKMYSCATSKARKFQIRLPGVTISTVLRGHNVGALYVFVDGNYAGKITQNGVLMLQFENEDVQNILLDANENLLQLAKAFGHESGSCSVCGRTLNDPLSVQMGIGPVCAKRLS